MEITETGRRVTGAKAGLSDTQAALTVPRWMLLVPWVVAVLLLVVAAQRPDGRLHVWVLDVGQGDAILIRTPKGHTALVDGGPGATALLNRVDERLPFWERELDLVVLTHPHADHLMGLIEVVERRHVGQVVQAAFTGTTAIEGEWLGLLREKGTPVHHAKVGDTIGFEGEEAVALRVLGPGEGEAAQGESRRDLNNGSVVMMLEYGEHDILLAGDVEEEVEAALVGREGEGLDAEVLKVAHHGSDTSSTPGFLEAVTPDVAIVSVGVGNRFAHPSPETLEALEQAGAKVFRTDLNGTVEVVVEGERMWVRGER